jgi:hypothetical protein
MNLWLRYPRRCELPTQNRQHDISSLQTLYRAKHQRFRFLYVKAQAGCGHDSVSAAIIQACAELAIEPHKVAKISSIGCSSKTPTYFLGKSHGFNSVHGRMPSVATGANLANRELHCIGISGVLRKCCTVTARSCTDDPYSWLTPNSIAGDT